MLGNIFKKILYLSLKNKGILQNVDSDTNNSEPILPDLEKNLEVIKGLLHESSDVTIHGSTLGMTEDSKVL